MGTQSGRQAGNQRVTDRKSAIQKSAEIESGIQRGTVSKFSEVSKNYSKTGQVYKAKPGVQPVGR